MKGFLAYRCTFGEGTLPTRARALAQAPDNQPSRLSLTQVPTQAEIPKNHSVLEGVVSGVAPTGNCFGVP